MSSPLSELLIGRASTAPLTNEGHLWACRSCLSVWVPSHSEGWFLRSPELAVGRASISPLTWGSLMSMPLPSERLSPLSFCRMSFSAPQSSVIGLSLFVGRASIAPLTIEGHLWACRSLLSVWVPSHSEEWIVLRPGAIERYPSR